MAAKKPKARKSTVSKGKMKDLRSKEAEKVRGGLMRGPGDD